MKKRIIYVIQLTLVTGLLVALGWLSYLLLGIVWSGFGTLSTGVKVAMVGGILTLSTALITRIYEKRKEIDAKLRERKLEVYNHFIDTYFQQLFSESRDPDFNMIKEFRKFSRNIILWGNTGVIKAFSEVRNKIGGATTLQSVRLFEKLLYEIRKDLGHSNWQLKQDELSRLFINDMDEMIAKK